MDRKETGRLDEVGDDELPLLARYMDMQMLLCYRNGEGWFEVHPLVREHVRRLAATPSPASPPER